MYFLRPLFKSVPIVVYWKYIQLGIGAHAYKIALQKPGSGEQWIWGQSEPHKETLILQKQVTRFLYKA